MSADVLLAAADELDAAFDWAAALNARLPTIDRDALKEAWQGAEGVRQREILKRRSPALLAQLVAFVRARIDELVPV